MFTVWPNPLYAISQNLSATDHQRGGSLNGTNPVRWVNQLVLPPPLRSKPQTNLSKYCDGHRVGWYQFGFGFSFRFDADNVPWISIMVWNWGVEGRCFCETPWFKQKKKFYFLILKCSLHYLNTTFTKISKAQTLIKSKFKICQFASELWSSFYSIRAANPDRICKVPKLYLSKASYFHPRGCSSGQGFFERVLFVDRLSGLCVSLWLVATIPAIIPARQAPAVWWKPIRHWQRCTNICIQLNLFLRGRRACWKRCLLARREVFGAVLLFFLGESTVLNVHHNSLFSKYFNYFAQRHTWVHGNVCFNEL